MALSEDDKRRIEEEEFRRAARNRARSDLRAQGRATTQHGKTGHAKSDWRWFGFVLAGLNCGCGFALLFVFPPAGIVVLGLGVLGVVAQVRKLP